MSAVRTFLLGCVCISISVCIGCGKAGDSGGTQPADTGKASTEKAPEVKKELKATLKIGDKEVALKNAKIRNDAMTPGEDSHKYSVYADPANEGDGLNLSFEYTKEGGAKDGYCSMKGYNIESVTVTIDSLEWKKGTYGGKMVTSVKGSFSGKLKMLDKNGFPTGDPIDFSGTFEK